MTPRAPAPPAIVEKRRRWLLAPGRGQPRRGCPPRGTARSEAPGRPSAGVEVWGGTGRRTAASRPPAGPGPGQAGRAAPALTGRRAGPSGQLGGRRPGRAGVRVPLPVPVPVPPHLSPLLSLPPSRRPRSPSPARPGPASPPRPGRPSAGSAAPGAAPRLPPGGGLRRGLGAGPGLGAASPLALSLTRTEQQRRRRRRGARPMRLSSGGPGRRRHKAGGPGRPWPRPLLACGGDRERRGGEQQQPPPPAPHRSAPLRLRRCLPSAGESGSAAPPAPPAGTAGPAAGAERARPGRGGAGHHGALGPGGGGGRLGGQGGPQHRYPPPPARCKGRRGGASRPREPPGGWPRVRARRLAGGPSSSRARSGQGERGRAPPSILGGGRPGEGHAWETSQAWLGSARQGEGRCPQSHRGPPRLCPASDGVSSAELCPGGTTHRWARGWRSMAAAPPAAPASENPLERVEKPQLPVLLLRRWQLCRGETRGDSPRGGTARTEMGQMRQRLPEKGSGKRVLPQNGWLWGACLAPKMVDWDGELLARQGTSALGLESCPGATGDVTGRRRGLPDAEVKRVAQQGNAKPASPLESGDTLRALGLSQTDP